MGVSNIPRKGKYRGTAIIAVAILSPQNSRSP